jgi:predicted nucleotidyltransferase
LPAITETGDLPQGVHRASLQEVLNQFGQATVQRRLVGMRLSRVHDLAEATRHVKRFIVFGSFVTEKPEPNDVDVFLLMDDAFDLDQVTGEARLVFDHPAAQAHFGASIFWLRRLAALPNEEEAVRSWQLKRDGTRRGIVEVKEA